MMEKHEIMEVLGKYLRWVNNEFIQNLLEQKYSHQNIYSRSFVQSARQNFTFIKHNM